MGLWKKIFGKKEEPVAFHFTFEPEPEPEQPPEPTLEEKLADALEAKEYGSARDIYKALGDYDKAAEMNFKSFSLSRDVSRRFIGTFKLLQEGGKDFDEAIMSVLSLCDERCLDYNSVIMPLTDLVDAYKKSTGYSSKGQEFVVSLPALIDSKLDVLEYPGQVGKLYEVCEDIEKAKEMYLQAASRNIGYGSKIEYRKKAGLSLREAVSTSVQELESFDELVEIAKKYRRILSTEDRRHILKNTRDVGGWRRNWKAKRAGEVRELFGWKKEAADFYVQGDKDSISYGLKIYGELGEDRAIVTTILKHVHSKHVEWAFDQLGYDEQKKDLLSTQLQLLKNLDGGKLPSADVTATFLGY